MRTGPGGGSPPRRLSAELARPPGALAVTGFGAGQLDRRLDGRVAGHVSLSRADEGDMAPVLWSERNGTSGEQAAVVGRLFVAPWARGHGIGALLIGRAAVERDPGGVRPLLLCINIQSHVNQLTAG
ncbi:GNAT family N-acetyltransferase [Streptomyces sviceus]|uniref:N-acetyltransferase domain-containing protein n=1 Tax=Streptomyces sviceus (strain ATCC 29083 / DSM 924 / JCM 4929 / NBRC 13980 / NCIMB 11184 / NRRL 5439 / UC 5370) TaxID=463191 RepID=B5I6C0_STRX2|nr:conserved hypothetical protein [Streptomyces sviceus ATCC 29083]